MYLFILSISTRNLLHDKSWIWIQEKVYALKMEIPLNPAFPKRERDNGNDCVQLSDGSRDKQKMKAQRSMEPGASNQAAGRAC